MNRSAVAIYIMIVVAALGGQHFIAKDAQDDIAKDAYENALAACERGNETVRAPVQDFLSAFVVDERGEVDDKNLLREAERVRDLLAPVPCSDVVDAP